MLSSHNQTQVYVKIMKLPLYPFPPRTMHLTSRAAWTNLPVLTSHPSQGSNCLPNFTRRPFVNEFSFLLPHPIWFVQEYWQFHIRPTLFVKESSFMDFCLQIFQRRTKVGSLRFVHNRAKIRCLEGKYQPTKVSKVIKMQGFVNEDARGQVKTKCLLRRAN